MVRHPMRYIMNCVHEPFRCEHIMISTNLDVHALCKYTRCCSQPRIKYEFEGERCKSDSLVILAPGVSAAAFNIPTQHMRQ